MGEYIMALPSSPEWGYFVRVLLASFCGFLIGAEREKRLKNAGIRTHILVCLASSLMMIVGKYGFFDVIAYPSVQVDASRIAASVVSAIGFLGTGVIFVRKENTIGVTTAAGLWSTVGIGICIGTGFYVVGFLGTLLVIVIQLLFHSQHFKNSSQTEGSVVILLKDTHFTIPELTASLKARDITMRSLRIKQTDKGLELAAHIMFGRKDNFDRTLEALRNYGEILAVDISIYG